MGPLVNMIDQVRLCLVNALALNAAEAAALTDSTGIADVEKWTSGTHLSVVMELEDTFGVQFDDDEVVELVSFSAILAALERKTP